MLCPCWPLLSSRWSSVVCFCLFFFSSRRRHTRFKCDWSSDVCSSDLPLPRQGELAAVEVGDGWHAMHPNLASWQVVVDRGNHQDTVAAAPQLLGTRGRSEERRVGKERRSRWSPYH